MQYGLLPEAANQFNPDALPIGISKTAVATPVKGWPAGDYAGLTCAACHEGEWDYKGKHVRIDGGAGNRLDILAYIHALDDALQETLSDSAKFDRLAARLGAASSDAEDKLRKRFERDADRVHHYRTRTAVSATPWGPGRLDAIALILNRLLADVPRHSSELVHAQRAAEAALSLECPSWALDTMARRATGSYLSQFG